MLFLKKVRSKSKKLQIYTVEDNDSQINIGDFNMDHGSICSGVEAAGLAWEKLGWKASFFAEVEPFPSAVLMHRFGATKPGGCIIEDSTHWQSEGEIKKVSQLPGLLNYYYRERVGK